MSRPRPEEVQDKVKFDSQELTSRLYRQSGQSFRANVNLGALPTKPKRKAIGGNPLLRKKQQLNSPSNAALSLTDESSVSVTPMNVKPLQVSGKRRLALLDDKPEEEKEEQRHSAVGVPPTLKKLLGDRVSLTSSLYKATSATVLGGADPGAKFSKLGQLPVSQSSLEAVQNFFEGESVSAVKFTTSKPSARVAPTKNERAQKPTANSTQEEYEKYLKSPFSFIDKVIESPYTEEFVYLNPRGSYDLEIVKHDQIDPDNYYTMSRAGVTHFYFTETDFTSLDQWEREYFLYTKMMEIPFLKKYRMWKAFYYWKKYICRMKSNKCRRILNENLYILNPHLRSSLINLRNLCYSASQWTLFNVDPRHTKTLLEFQEAQEVQKGTISEKLEDLNEEVRAIVQEACEVDLREFLIENGFRTANDSTADVEGGDGEYIQKISHAEKAAIRTKCRKLTKYIRLADYFIIDTLVSLSFERTNEILEMVEGRSALQLAARKAKAKAAAAAAEAAAAEKSSNKKKRHTAPTVDPKTLSDQPLFCTEAMLDEDTNQLGFVPKLEEFQLSIEASIDSSVRTVMAPKRLITDPNFLQYTQQNLEEGDDDQSAEFNLESMVLQDPTFVEVKVGIQQGLANAFGAAAEYEKSFEPFKEKFLNNESTDIGSFAGADIGVITNLVHKFESEMKEFETMKEKGDIGIIQVDAAALKGKFIPAPARCQKELHTLLPEVAAKKTTELLDELKDLNNKISVIPATVEEFVVILNLLQQINDSQEATAQRYTFIAELYQLMQDNEIKFPSRDHKNFDNLTSMRSTFKTQTLLSEASVSGNVEKFSKDLDTKIPLLNKELKKLDKDLQIPMISDADANQDEVIAYLDEKNALLKDKEDEAKRYVYYQEVLQVAQTDFDNIKQARNDLNVRMDLWNGLKSWDALAEGWVNTKFADVNLVEIEDTVKQYNKTYAKAKRMLEDNKAVPVLRDKVVKIQDVLPVIGDLRNPNLLDHHWEEITELLNYDLRQDENFTLGTLVKLDAMSKKTEIQKISVSAHQEASLRGMVSKVENTWAELMMPVNQHKGSKDIFVLGNLEDIMTGLDDSLVTVNTILGSRFVGPIKAQVDEWSQKLVLFQETLEEWGNCQRAWMYLETIFASQDIIRQLPEEAAMFSQVDKGWKEIMRRTNDSSNAISAGTHAGLKENLINYNTILDKVQKQLESYLETKRMAFPRFYFLSNDELLVILAESRNVNAVQPHLRKCFDNLVQLEFADKDIKAMISSEGERVPLGANLKARGSVEVWLSALEADSVKTLRRLMKEGCITYDKMSRREWILEKFGQIVMTVSQITWCRGCEEAITSKDPVTAFKEWIEVQLSQLSVLTQLVRGNLASTDRKKIVSLVTTDVHCRDVTMTMQKEGVHTLNNFIWQQQLRFYWDQDDDDCIVRQSNGRFFFGYEYMGVTSRLVITPLTDRCWMTITGALHLKFGAAPAGPAGTGKTESSKDLAKAMGVYCVVFNCSDQITYQTMAKLFSGLAQAGAWTCLDEFNRIDIEVLSVVAQQVLQIRQAMLVNAKEFVFQGQQISMKGRFGVIITMNPGYAGRTELPDNLKVLFRDVSMMIPDYALIAEIMLFAEGFDTALRLSKKMVKLYKLASEQLSQQDHYDFGMRAVKSVLVMAGGLKRAEPDLTEDIVLIRAMKDANIPKFLAHDIPLFNAIVQDLFPGVEIPLVDYGELETAIKDSCEKQNLQKVPKFITNVIQLYDTFCVRFGVMIVGPTGAGKSSCYRTLQMSMTKLRAEDSKNPVMQTVHTHVLNPKSVTMGELYGEINAMTQEWTDGLASTIMRQSIADNSDDRHWVTFDGPVDAIWIENMNTVLDDNMTLCLVNGERIKLKVELRMLFEVQDLAVASPATVSRCGMVYMTPTDLGVLPYVRSWIPTLSEKLSQELKDYIYELFTTYVPEGLKFMRTLKEPIPTVDIQVVTSLCNLFEVLLTEEHGVNFEQDEPALKRLISMLYAFCFAWGFGGSLNEDSQKLMNKNLNTIFADFKPAGSLFDHFLDLKEMEWKPWNTIVPPFVYDANKAYFDLVVPTEDSVKFSWLMETVLENQKSVFFTGVSGVGKTVIVQSLFTMKAEAKGLVPIVLNFSAQTNARQTQENIESKLVKLRRTQLGPPVGKKLVIFVDDVNMPSVETYGAQPPIELLRQFQDHKGFYDRVKLFWKDIVDTTIVSAAAPPGGGRNALTQRFTRHSNIFCVPNPPQSVLKTIFGSIVEGFLKAFKPAVQKLKDPMVLSSIEMYDSIRAELLPIPAKSHYTFNLRDISKIFQGILMIKPDVCKEPDIMTRLWIHESQRCLHDRLIDVDDKLWFTQKVCDLLSKNFSLTWTHEDLFEKGQPMYGDFFRPGANDYEQKPVDLEVSNLLDDYLEEYNMQASTPMKLVFFEDAIAHIARIARILRQPRGNALLVGVGGSGKQSLTRLACGIADFKCFQIELTRGYSHADFMEFIKMLMTEAGVGGKNTAFLFTENQIVDEVFVEDINNLLNSGEIPNLFASDEIAKICDDMIPVMDKLGIAGGRSIVWATFVDRVREYLHVVLCMSPVGSAFRVRCRQFPSLINCCTIDWYTAWPEQALRSVSDRFMAEIELPSPEIRESLAESCVVIHQSMEASCDKFYNELRRKVYTTPKSYLDMISLYFKMLKQKRDELNTNLGRLEVGLKKLSETTLIVDELQAQLVVLKPQLIKSAGETDVLLKQVAIDQAEADKVKVVVEAETQEVNQQAKECGEIQADAQKDLDLALPALKNAVKALDKLNKGDISEMKAMKKPPETVKLVLEAVCTMMGFKADWDTAQKKVLGDVQLLKNLKEFDKDNIPEKRIKALQKYVTNEILADEAVCKVSQAAGGLMKWVSAMDIYSKVAKEVEPKTKRVQEMNELLAKANATLKTKQDQLKEIVDKVNALQKTCNEAVAEKSRLSNDMAQTEGRLKRAEQLISGLGGEAVRWTADAASLRNQLIYVVGDAFISAALVSYAGPFTGVYREELVKSWHELCLEREIPVAAEFSLRATMGRDVEIRGWNIKGLPSDAVSTDSAIMSKYGSRFPLMIDPQEQAKKWVINTYKQDIVILRMNNPDMLKHLEGAIRNGSPFLIEDIAEDIEGSLDPVLNKAVFEQGGRKVIRLGENDVDYDDNFKFFMTTKLPNPHYMPEVFIKVNLLNFTVTKDGLEDQLLGEVVKLERPDVEEKMNNLVVSMAEDAAQLSELEARILKLLSESKGNILDDQVLIDTLAESKSTSTIIQQRVGESVETQNSIKIIREKYRTVATRGSILYFVIASMSEMDPMYQTSLAFFMKLFNAFIEKAEKSDDLDTRLSTLMTYITENSYLNICRGLFEKDKSILSFLFCLEILMEQGTVLRTEWMFLLRVLSAPETLERESPDETIFDKQKWYAALEIENQFPEAFSGFCDSIANDLDSWKAYVTHQSPHTQDLPGTWNSSLSNFQKLMVLKCFRSEKLIFATNMFVGVSLGKLYTEPVNIRLEDVHADSDTQTPIIFVLSQGADPTGMLLRLAKDKNFTEKLDVISLGQGQGPNAQRLVKEGKKSGRWVLLQNCHLAKSWMGDLEKMVDLLAEEPDIHEDFRLWLTSMPATYFPVAVLQKGIKLTNEPPKGMRANCFRTYKTVVDAEAFETCEKSPQWKKLLFGLCFFHATIQERKKFGPLGWNIMYQFNDSDLEISISVLRMFLDEQEHIPFDALLYVCGHINYGGRVTDDWDRRCLLTILGRFFNVDILKDGYKFSESGLYFAPTDGNLDSYVDYIMTLPQESDPEIFGMHENANLSSQAKDTKLMLETILSVQPRASAAGDGKTPDEIVAEMAQEFLEKCPELLEFEMPNLEDEEEEEAEAPKEGEEGEGAGEEEGEGEGEEKPKKEPKQLDSLIIVLSQEVERFNKLLRRVKSTLLELQKAIRGEVVMNADLDKMYTCLMNNQVPDLWTAVAFPSLKPLGSWYIDLIARIAMFDSWCKEGVPKSYWMPGFFFPQGFMTGVLQNFARKYKVAIDTLRFRFEVLPYYKQEEVLEHPEDGVYAHGFFMDGARWDPETMKLADSHAGELFSVVPAIHFLPTNTYTPSKEDYECPLYKTSKRAGILSTTGQSTNFILEIILPTSLNPDYWVLKGAAMLCMLDY